jgi:DNA invertase Pin-like site-specific DNA recombinase
VAQPNHRRDPDKIRRVKELHAQGLSRNAIHRELGIPQESVSNIARDAGLSFDRARTRAATQAKVDDARKARVEIIHRLYGQAIAGLDRLDLPEHHLKEASAGKVVAYTADYLPAQDVKALITAIGTAAEKAVRLEQVDADTLNLPAVDAWLDHMVNGQPEDPPTDQAAPDTGGG